LMPKVVEELCRFHQGSAMATRRVAKVDVEYGGKASTRNRLRPCLAQWPAFSLTGMQTIKAGEGIIAACQSGNRDEAVFASPDNFDIHRSLNPSDNLGFGYGAHRCIAEELAKAELDIALGTIVCGNIAGMDETDTCCRHSVPASAQHQGRRAAQVFAAHQRHRCD
jgi:nitric oxide reductase